MDMNDAKRYLNQAMHIMKSATSRVVDSAAQNRRVWMLGAGMYFFASFMYL